MTRPSLSEAKGWEVDVKLNIISVVSGVIEAVDEVGQTVTVRYRDEGLGLATAPGQGLGEEKPQRNLPNQTGKFGSARGTGLSGGGGTDGTTDKNATKAKLTGPKWPGKLQIDRPVREQALGKYVIMDKEGDVRGLVTRIEGQGKNIQVQLLDESLRLEDGRYSWVSYAGKGADGFEMLWYADKGSAPAEASLTSGGATTVATLPYLSNDIAWMKPPAPTVTPPVTAFTLAKAMPELAPVPIATALIPTTPSPSPSPVKPPTTPAPPLADACCWSVELKGEDVQDETGKWQEEYYPATIGNYISYTNYTRSTRE